MVVFCTYARLAAFNNWAGALRYKPIKTESLVTFGLEIYPAYRKETLTCKSMHMGSVSDAFMIQIYQAPIRRVRTSEVDDPMPTCMAH